MNLSQSKLNKELRWNPFVTRLGPKRWNRYKHFIHITLLAVLAAALSYFSYSLDQQQHWLDSHGIPISATEAGESAVHSYRSGATLSYNMNIAFRDQSGTIHDTVVEVSRNDYLSYQPGQKFDILYNPNHPNEAKPQNYDINNWWWAEYLIIYVVILYGILFGWVAAIRLAHWHHKRASSDTDQSGKLQQLAATVMNLPLKTVKTTTTTMTHDSNRQDIDVYGSIFVAWLASKGELTPGNGVSSRNIEKLKSGRYSPKYFFTELCRDRLSDEMMTKDMLAFFLAYSGAQPGAYNFRIYDDFKKKHWSPDSSNPISKDTIDLLDLRYQEWREL